jgi:DNA repair exonuclease SbcCD ATPase subunit
LDKSRTRKEQLTEFAQALEQSQVLIQTTAKETQERLRYHIQDIVQTALDTCFPGEYDFIVNFEIKRGRTEADMFLEREGERINPMEASGGGVVDMISFALRLSAWTLSRTDNLIVLDEPYKFLSANLRPLAGEILRELSEKLQLQILIVTHDPIMIDAADQIFEVNKKKDRSVVEARQK